MRSSVYKAFVFFICLTFFLTPGVLSAATLSVSPASGTFEVGQRITVKVVVSSASPINAISGVVSLPTGLFSVESVSKAGSLLNFWVTEPNFSNGAGTLHFEGVTLGGFSGGTGTVVTVVLRALKPGTGSATFQSGQVLANDGQGTNVTDGTTGATYSVVPASKQVEEPTPVVPVEAPQPKSSLSAPEIVLTEKFGEQAISGISNYPNAQVLLTFTSEGGTKVFITSYTDNQGAFLMLVPKTLKRGDYKVHAVVIRNDLSNSHQSNEITVSIGSIFSDLGWEILIPLLLLILVLIYLIIRSYYYLTRNKDLKSSVRKEAHEANKMLHKSFKIIREDVGSDKQVKKDLDAAEDVISKEIEDIENL